MDTKNAFGKALKHVRVLRGLTQEDFSLVSSRTYLSVLERGLKSPTIEKLEAISGTLNVHPVTLLAFAYLLTDKATLPNELFSSIADELDELYGANIQASDK